MSDQTLNTKEAVYDAEIAPLMTQVIEICKRRKIAVLATFALGDRLDGSATACTTALLSDEYEPPNEMLRAFREIYVPRNTFAAFTISKGGA